LNSIDSPISDHSLSSHKLPITQWVAEDRPREKLYGSGIANLTEAELVAIIFGSGVRTKKGTLTAVELARSVLRQFGGLWKLSEREAVDIRMIDGVGKAKAAQLSAAFELGRRIESSKAEKSAQIGSPADVAAIYGPLMRGLKIEIFRVVLLNTANVVMSDFVVSEGGLSASIVESRAVFKKAIVENAASIICLHNHPSGNTEPSKQDIAVTRQLVESGKLLGIPVRDHIIIAGRDYTSLAERGHIT